MSNFRTIDRRINPAISIAIGVVAPVKPDRLLGQPITLDGASSA